MNKKERKANAILAEAQALANQTIERINNEKKALVVPKRTFSPKKKIKSVDEEKENIKKLSDFGKNIKFHTFTISKVEKGKYRVTAMYNSEKYVKDFKSITKAQEWCSKHGMER